ncbi:MAG: hypothetical protein PF481_00915 [Bacteroidales bacterium]|jgi:hypothetical protein|nr:hypothetical protein [Bacteroidales bacterium]
MNTIKIISAKRLLLFMLPFIPFVIFLNSSRTNVVSIYADYPKEIIAGTHLKMTVTIEKGNLTGFGRYTHSLPEGFTATSDARNFELENNTIKFLWVNLPYSQSFTFTYTIHVPETYEGDFTVAAKFGYIMDNNRRFTELIPQNVHVINDPLALRKYRAQMQAQTQKVRPEEITAYRTVSVQNNEAIVSIRINKKHLQAMSKIEELLPQGYSFYALERQNAAFSTQNNVARFMWIKAPEQNIFTVSYKVISNTGYSINDLYITGAFSYLDDGKTHSIVILEKDLNAIDESTGKSENINSSLGSKYDTHQDVSFGEQELSSSPERVNASEYSSGLDPNLVHAETQKTNIQSSPNNTNQNTTINSQPQSQNIAIEQDDAIYDDDLETVLEKKQYNQEQVNFFTNTNINSQPQNLTQDSPVQFYDSNKESVTTENTAERTITDETEETTSPSTVPTQTQTPSQTNTSQPTQTSETQDNISNQTQRESYSVSETLDKTSAQKIPTRTAPVPVNINAIPEPSTYFSSTPQNSNIEDTTTDIDMISKETNPSYSENMENENLLGNPQEYSDDYDAPQNQQYAENTTQTSQNNNIPETTNNQSTEQSNNMNTSEQGVPTNAMATGNGTTENQTQYSQHTEPQVSTDGNTYVSGTTAHKSQQNTQTPSANTATNTTNTSERQNQQENNQSIIKPRSAYGTSNQTGTGQESQVVTKDAVLQNQDVTLTQSELAFQSNLDIPSPLDGTTASQAVPTQKKNTTTIPTPQTIPEAHSTNEPPHLSQKNMDALQEIQTDRQTIDTDLSQEGITYNTKDDEKPTARLSNKNDISQQETHITRIQKQNGLQGVYYRVQISASNSLVNAQSYFKRFKIQDNIVVERISGWYKYSIEHLTTYLNARDHRNSVWNETPIKDAFVVAYNGETRITVQEALMLTNQQWAQ